MQSTRDTRFLAPFTFGVRIHHGYVGCACLGLLALIPPGPVMTVLLWVGASLALSDIIHHFAVLLPVTGRHEFDLVYPSERVGSDGPEQRSDAISASGVSITETHGNDTEKH